MTTADRIACCIQWARHSESCGKHSYLHTQHAPLIHAAICVGDSFASNPIPNPWDLPDNHRLHVEGDPVHNPIVGRNELSHSPNPGLQAQ